MSGASDEVKLWLNIAVSCCLLVSEIMPFIGSNDYNGILHFIAAKLKLCASPSQAERQEQQQQRILAQQQQVR